MHLDVVMTTESVRACVEDLLLDSLVLVRLQIDVIAAALVEHFIFYK